MVAEPVQSTTPSAEPAMMLSATANDGNGDPAAAQTQQQQTAAAAAPPPAPTPKTLKQQAWLVAKALSESLEKDVKAMKTMDWTDEALGRFLEELDKIPPSLRYLSLLGAIQKALQVELKTLEDHGWDERALKVLQAKLLAIESAEKTADAAASSSGAAAAAAVPPPGLPTAMVRTAKSPHVRTPQKAKGEQEAAAQQQRQQQLQQQQQQQAVLTASAAANAATLQQVESAVAASAQILQSLMGQVEAMQKRIEEGPSGGGRQQEQPKEREEDEQGA